MTDLVRSALRQISSLRAAQRDIAPDHDLFEAGLSSFDLINLIMCLEDLYGIEFPPDAMRRENFATIDRIHETLAALRGEAAAR